ARGELDAIIGEIDMGDRTSIIYFGAKTQQKMSQVSENMLEGVKNKDLGTVGDSLNSMITAIRGFDVDELMEKPGFFARLFGKAKPIAKFIGKYEDVRKQIDAITDQLNEHKTTLLTDIVSLEKLYDANIDYFHQLELYISAGEEKLRRLDEEDIPKLAEEAAGETESMLKAQELRDLRSARDDLERRVHDLRLTRQVAMQSLPSIRLVQENDKGLISKINSTLVNTVPLWKNQLAQAVTIFRSGRAAETLKRSTDLTNDLLEANAENLKQANAQVRKQMERGVFDIDSVKKANQTLIDTINESLQIADEGKKSRAAALQELKTMENELRETLLSAKAKTEALPAASADSADKGAS
ncbi:MAG TPA: toxic anion resistance protein, partial [Chromatiaceae bacterium]|nr:toxic anion resistance protein [Chromatiaceae bacterium]